MSSPALRQPKSKSKKFNKPVDEYVILTLKGDKKLVVSSDGYHSIIKTESAYFCVLCGTKIAINEKLKAEHKSLEIHLKALELFPHLESFRENLIRQLNKNTCYCTICNVILSTNFLMRHVEAEHHKLELEKASTRSAVYKPK